jgi:hypothetical protein
MRVIITGIVAPEVRAQIGSATTRLEERLGPILSILDYGGGIEQFSVFFVSVESDPFENERYCIANNRASRYKDFLTGKTVKFVGIAAPIDPEIVLASSEAELSKCLENLLLEELESPPYAMPKKFDRQRLLADLRVFLARREGNAEP